MTETVRKISRSLAPILEALELDQPKIVTTAYLESLQRDLRVKLGALNLARELQRRGWLLPLRTRNAWEFAPASRAGAYSSGDRFIELRATLLRKPQLPIAVAEESAAWLHGLASRFPTKDAIAAPKQLQLPAALSGFRVVRFSAQLPSASVDGIPVWAIGTLLAAMAIKPSEYHDWPNVQDWLAEAVAKVDRNDLVRELLDYPRSAWARAAFLCAVGGQDQMAASLFRKAPQGKGPYYLGPRSSGGTYNARYEVIDSLLRTRPREAN